MSRDHDMRLNDSWGLWCQRQFQERPEIAQATEGATHFGAFAAGWHYRHEAAAAKVGTSGSDPDMAIVRDTVEFYRALAERAFNERWAAYLSGQATKRMLASQAEMIRGLKGDPLDAPAWRRISEQRKEIKRLTAENLRLRGAIERDRPVTPTESNPTPKGTDQ